MKFAFFILLILGSTTIYSQNDSVFVCGNAGFYTPGLESSAGFDSRSGEYTLTNSLCFTTRKSFFSLGHISIIDSYHWKERKSNGIEFNYKFYPNGKNKRINLYLLNRTFLLSDKLKNSYQVNYYNWPAPFTDIAHRSSKRVYFESFVGYGIRLKLSRIWYLYQANVIGISFLGEHESTNYEIHEANSWSNSRHLFDETTAFSYSIQLGLGFGF